MDFPLPSLVCVDDLQAMEKAAGSTPKGCFVEVGVYQGGSAAVLYRVAECQGREIFLYDTFTGIPYKDPIDSHNIGDFSDSDPAKISETLPNARVIQGIFPHSAIKMPAVAFVHLDVDQYRSYKESVEYLEPMMVPGGIMWFDDYGCTPGATEYLNQKFGSRMEKDGKYFMRF